MKNYEKYANEIKEYKGTHFCKGFIEKYIIKPGDCNNIGCTRCKMIQMLWLLEDCKEPEEPKIDWNKVEVDTPILVRAVEGAEWIKRHFAKYENELVYTWKDSRTSWTSSYDNEVTGWKYAKLVED